jgi:outer membrane putative beta-barrel porin/alpha-amylase
VPRGTRVHGQVAGRAAAVGATFTLASSRKVPRLLGVLAACALSTSVTAVRAQDIEPRAYSNAPVGVNFLITGYVFTRGGLSFDTAVPVTNAKLRTSSAFLAYARVLDLWGRSGKFDVAVPYTWLSGTADYVGQPTQRIVSGGADPKFRWSINFYGAPATTLKDFAGYRQDAIVGASVEVSMPSGQYDSSRVVNIGTNRWSFKPEIGVSKAVGPWTLELTAAATLYTDNDDFFGGTRRSQDTLYSTQAHVIYGFRSGIWASLDATYFTGGRTTIGGTRSNDLQRNWRMGATVAFPVDVHNSIKLYASSGTSSRTGNDYDLVGIAWQTRWGGGL